MALEINNDPHIGARVKLVGGTKGIILRKTINFDFPLWDIKLNSGKVVTEARYRFDILEDSVQNIEPEITITNTITKQKLPPLVPAIDPCPTDEFSDDHVMGVTEHHQMTWGDVKILRDNSPGLEYLQMNERNTKTRTGKSLRDQRDIPQMAWANPENELKCPVHAYKLFRSKHPLKFSNPTDPFYIQKNTNTEKSGLWYKSQPIGINKLGKFMKKMATAAGIIQSKDDNDESENDPGNRRLTNHSARRFMLQKLDDAGFEHNHIKQNGQKTAVTENQVSFGNLAAAPTGLSCLFGGPIYGGTFNINISNLPSLSPSPQTTKRCRYVIESDSSQE
ncbi:unnamed protein product [Mytilus coruscus]|uniref:ZMYM2-like/QRICH1 C-terminal domain-containing protein n=1 Tax=Mytilus coruscus TaxID=42192 RepID=A0A6J8EXE9_MYTCO|nr:unnamed protein product [Mytilus coruscus]